MLTAKRQETFWEKPQEASRLQWVNFSQKFSANSVLKYKKAAEKLRLSLNIAIFKLKPIENR